MEGAEQALEVEAEVTELLTRDTARQMLQGIMVRGESLLGESHLLWQPWLEWELAILKDLSGTER
jgi:hypothetical protein